MQAAAERAGCCRLPLPSHDGKGTLGTVPIIGRKGQQCMAATIHRPAATASGSGRQGSKRAEDANV